MKLTVVGCAPAYSTLPDRSSSCYLIEEGDTRVLLDLGQGSFANLWRYASPAQVTAVVISHMHADHNVDLVPLRHWARYGHKGVGPELYGPTDLRPRYAEFQMAYSEPSPLTDFFADLKGGALAEGEFAVGDLRIEARHVTHIPDSFAFRVSAASGNGPAFVYSGDCGDPDDLLPLVQPRDILLCEAGFGIVRDAPGIHLTAGEAGSVAQRTQAARLILTHFHDRSGTEPLIDAANKEYRAGAELAVPGLTLDIGYARAREDHA
ncbi:MAG: MBL fold metallo-hydrolase [Chloroflexota bacterium]